jgi:predicted nucleic acid-binding Zn ribbon protein
VAKKQDPELEELAREMERRRVRIAQPKRIGEVVSGLLARNGYAHAAAHQQCAAAWQEAVGEKLAADSRVGNLRGGVLEVVVRNSIVLQELTFQKRQVTEKLTILLPELRLRGLRFRVGAIS